MRKASRPPKDDPRKDHAVHDSLVDLVGDTPLVRLRRLTAGLSATVLVKIEYFNPGGSVKDRAATAMVLAAERDGSLTDGGTIVEGTSGNTGIGLARRPRSAGYRTSSCCRTRSRSRRSTLLRAYGAEVVRRPPTSPASTPPTSYNLARRIAEETPAAGSPTSTTTPPTRRSTTKPPARRSGRDRGPGHAPGGVDRHRRHDLRHRAVPQGAGPRRGRRRRPGHLALPRRRRQPVLRGGDGPLPASRRPSTRYGRCPSGTTSSTGSRRSRTATPS